MMAWRHDLHQHPELGFEEHRTAAKVAEQLAALGLEVHTGVGGTGVVGVLRRGDAPRAIALRADMDALPICETNDLAYRSATSGVMHACGHDGHTAMLLGAAKHLSEKGAFDGAVVFVFQPNEENSLGASAMLRDGLFDANQIETIYGMHNIPGMPLNHFATRPGPITASENLFEIEISARGGHAALPHMGVDAILVGAEIVSALQTIVSRKLDPSMNGVVSVTEFLTDGKRNVLPGTATLKGDARALAPESNKIIEARMRQIVDGVCQAHGVTATVSYDTQCQPTLNDPGAAMAATRAARLVAGDAQTDPACAPKLFSEDFAHLALHRPGCFMLMGNGIDGPHARPLHSADYDFNDAALVPGSSFWVELVETELPVTNA
ncbi:MAG: amidohydrolase [Rhodobacteraceae bacterium]|nr:amidohydrolase [Paracoccaceae bacterium]